MTGLWLNDNFFKHKITIPARLALFSLSSEVYLTETLISIGNMGTSVYTYRFLSTIFCKLLFWGFLLNGVYLIAQPTTCMPEMVFVEGGEFDMGCTAEQHQAMVDNGFTEGCHTDWAKDELPVHTISLRQFFIGKYEVTQGQWAAIMPKDTMIFNAGMGVNYPVYHVSWYDAITFCNRLSIREGFTPCYYADPKFIHVFDSLVGRARDYVNVYWNTHADGYRLPIEAEWEYAARGGNQSQQFAYAGSHAIDEVAIYDKNNTEKGGKPVGTKAPNELGLYDLSGNEWEWVWDWHLENYYRDSPECQPIGPVGSDNKVCRGGNWRSSAAYSRVANRIGLYPGLRTFNIGFRIARGKMEAGYCSTKGT